MSRFTYAKTTYKIISSLCFQLIISLMDISISQHHVIPEYFIFHELRSNNLFEKKNYNFFGKTNKLENLTRICFIFSKL